MVKRLLAVLVVLSVAGIAWVALGGWQPWRNNIAPEFERGSATRCPGDRPDRWLSEVTVRGTLIRITQTDAGARAGADEPDAFAERVLGCLVELGGDADELGAYRPNMSCELWLHNLATVARNGDARSSAALNKVPGLAGVLARGRPVDMNTAVWAGNVPGRPWDGRTSVCTAVRRVLRST